MYSNVPHAEGLSTIPLTHAGCNMHAAGLLRLQQHCNWRGVCTCKEGTLPALRPLCGTTSPILCLQSPNGVDIQGAKRVAIFDFDVHHGNGTEAIVRNLHPSRVVKTIQVPGGMLTTTSIMYKPWVDNKVTPHTALCIQQYCAYALALTLALAGWRQHYVCVATWLWQA